MWSACWGIYLHFYWDSNLPYDPSSSKAHKTSFFSKCPNISVKLGMHKITWRNTHVSIHFNIKTDNLLYLLIPFTFESVKCWVFCDAKKISCSDNNFIVLMLKLTTHLVQ